MKRKPLKMLAAMLAVLMALTMVTFYSSTKSIMGDQVGFKINDPIGSFVPTDPMVLSDNASVLAVADSGSGTQADPFIIENRIFQLNYSASGIITLGMTCYLTIRNCFFNASDPSGVGAAFIASIGPNIENCTFQDCGLSGLAFIIVLGGRMSNIVMINRSGLLLDSVDDLHAENLTLIDSMLVAMNLGILTHQISHNLTFANINAYESGAVLTSGFDFLMTDVEDVTFTNYNLSCEVDTCSTFLINSTNVTFSRFNREGPELGVLFLNVTGLDILSSNFNMDDNGSISLVSCNDVMFQNTTFLDTGSSTQNIMMVDCTGIIMDNNSFSGGNISLSMIEASNVFIQDNQFLSNNHAIFLSGVNDSIIQNNTFSFVQDAFLVSGSLNLTVTENIFENMTSGDVINSSSDISGMNITRNAYWDYFDINPGLKTVYYSEGSSLPIEYEIFPATNDTEPFYSEYLFGTRVVITITMTILTLVGDPIDFYLFDVFVNGTQIAGPSNVMTSGEDILIEVYDQHGNLVNSSVFSAGSIDETFTICCEMYWLDIINEREDAISFTITDNAISSIHEVSSGDGKAILLFATNYHYQVEELDGTDITSSTIAMSENKVLIFKDPGTPGGEDEDEDEEDDIFGFLSIFEQVFSQFWWIPVVAVVGVIVLFFGRRSTSDKVISGKRNGRK